MKNRNMLNKKTFFVKRKKNVYQHRYQIIEQIADSILEENKEAFKKLSQWITSHLIICYNIHDGRRLGLQTRESI